MQISSSGLELNRKSFESDASDLVVFSHLRWDFVFQRPQQLMSRFAKERRVYYVEEPIHSDLSFPTMHVSDRQGSLRVVVPYLPREMDSREGMVELSRMMCDLIEEEGISDFTAWYYTPMALAFTGHLKPSITVYDCMDELSAFHGAPAGLLKYEAELFEIADVVFTGGQSLYEAKKERHPNVHAFPSSIDFPHFASARRPGQWLGSEPGDQAMIRGPRIGFFGVIDERLDTRLLEEASRMRPEWNWILIGPIVKIDPASLPRHENIHYLGMKSYADLPAYLAGWDLAVLPFARNESTRFISPTKTPEYLAGGRPVVSTSIRDVIRPYGEEGLVHIADEPKDFVLAAETAMWEHRHDPSWQRRVDDFLASNSWDTTCLRMSMLEKSARRIALEA